MLALRVPVALAPATLAFRLAPRSGGKSAHAGDAFAVPFGMAAGDPSVLGVRLAFAFLSNVACPISVHPGRQQAMATICVKYLDLRVTRKAFVTVVKILHEMDAGATVAALAGDGTVAINFAVTSRGAGAMSLVIARLPSGGMPVAGCLEVGSPVWSPVPGWLP